MTSIRTLLDQHIPITGVRIPERPGFCQVEARDYHELMDIAPVPINVYAHDDRTVTVRIDEFEVLVQAAHDKLHRPAEQADERRAAAEALRDFGLLSEGAEESEEESKAKTFTKEEEAQIRNVSMHYAVQVAVAEVQASHGLDLSPGDNLVKRAETILAFLRA